MIPLIVITGPTASGKTDVALQLAREFDGEIVCADSRTVYKGLDIGTAKPSRAERAVVPHHILDCVSADEYYNLAQFQHDARAAIADIRRRGKTPFLVGGSGLYVDSIVLEYQLREGPDQGRRAELESLSLEQLYDYSNENNIKLPDNSHNKRYVIRAIEQKGINTMRRSVPDENTIVVAINTETDELKQRIQRRSRIMFNSGLVQEAEAAATRYGWEIAPLQAPGYRASRRLLDNEITIEEAIAAFARDDWQIARKQMTWLRRHRWLHWLGSNEIEPFVRSILIRPDSN